MNRRLIFAIALIGFTSMAAQIVLMRELLIIFYGNELSLGLTLASWLFWIALGSWIASRVINRTFQDGISFFALCQIILAFLLPLSILAVRFIPLLFRFLPGEFIGIIPMSIATFIMLAPVCILGGFLFVLGCQIYRVGTEKAAQIGYVYILEALGASIGGLLTSLVLIKYFNPLYIMFFIGFLNIICIYLLLYRNNISGRFIIAVFLGILFILMAYKADFLNSFSLKKQWRGYKLLASKNSIYGNVAVTKQENLFSIFENGLYSFTVPDELTSERNAHLPLLEHPAPKEVLLIGGGSSGILKEVLKHPVVRVDYVELDPLIIDLSSEYLPSNQSLNDVRVRITSNMDGRLFVKRTSNKYDVVMINLPEPHTAQLNRFYTKEFYTEVNRILKTQGILSFCLYSNPNSISKEQIRLYRTLENTLKTVFPQVIITPGEVNYFLASNKKGILTLDSQILINRLDKRKIQANYLKEYYLLSELTSDRIDYFNKSLSQEGMATINTDFHPIAYYYDMILWSAFFKYNLKNVFQAISPKIIYLVCIVVYLCLLIPMWPRFFKHKINDWALLVCVGTTGFAEITFQIVTLLSFQVLYGYVYYKLGIILTSFMIGLILGGWLITKMIEKQRANYNLFIKTQIAIFIYPLILPLVFVIFLNMKSSAFFNLGSNIILPFLPIIPGFIGGFQFPLANSLYLKNKSAQVTYAAGLSYGIDLFGSCLGALLTCVILIPIIGIPSTCFLVAGLNLIGLILLLKR